jgi:hypothetical protein
MKLFDFAFYFLLVKYYIKGQVWWLTAVSPTTWEVEAGGS